MNSKHEGNKPAETPGVQYVRIGSTNNPQQQPTASLIIVEGIIIIISIFIGKNFFVALI